MSKFTTLVSKFARDDEGAALAEYAVLIGLITAGTIAAITTFAGGITTRLLSVCATIKGSAC